MKKLSFTLFLAILIAGCGRPAEKKDILARINNYEITTEEFLEDFRDSNLGKINTPEAKKEFLSNLINRVLILQAAEQEGIDKNKKFLRMVQKFWEQSLLKLALERKTAQITNNIRVSDKEIEDKYNTLIKDGKTDKTYQQLYNQLKWEIFKEKEAAELNAWIASLNKKAQNNIEINTKLLDTNQ